MMDICSISKYNEGMFKKIINSSFIYDLYLVLCISEFMFRGSVFSVNKYDELRQATILAGIAILIIKIFSKKIKNDINSKYMLMIFIVCCLSLCFTGVRPSADTVSKFLARVLMVVNLYLLNDKKDYTLVYVAFLLETIFVDVYSLVVSKDYLIYSTSFRAIRLSGIYENYNILGMNNLFSFLISLIYILKEKKTTIKIIAIISFVLSFVCIYLSACRTAILAILISVAIILTRKYKKEISISIAVLIIVISSFLFLNKEKLFANSLNREDFTQFEQRINYISSSRYIIYKEGLYLFFKNPVLGYGVDNIKDVAKAGIEANKQLSLAKYTHVHFMPLDNLLEMGIVGSFVFWAFLYKKIKLIYQNLDNKELTLFYMLIIAALTYSMLDKHIGHYMYPMGFFFWTSLSKIELELKEK